MNIFDLASETRLSIQRKNIFAIVIIFVVLLSIYSNTFHAAWHFDDGPNILDNRALHLTHLNWENIKRTFFASWGGGEKLYRPAACFSFALNYYFGGTDVTGYHMVNLTIHCLCCVFLFLFIRNTLSLPLLKTRYGSIDYPIALLASVLWAINPVQTEAVTYVVQRMTSMAGMFYIMSMYFYLKGRISTNIFLRSTHYIFFIVASIFAFNSKENAVMLIISIYIFDLLLVQGITKESLRRHFFVLSIVVIACLITAFLLKGPFIFDPEKILSGYTARGFTLFERLLTEPRVVLFYISLLLYPMPHRLCLVHDISVSKGVFDPPTTIIAILVILALLALAILKSKRWPLVSFCIIFFFINHIIESTVLPLELAFEHRNYIPSMLFFVPIAILFVRAITFFSDNVSLKIIIAAFLIGILIVFGYSTFVRNSVWKTDETLWLDAVTKCPNLPRTHHNLGKYYDDIGLKRTALKHYQQALQLPEGPNRRSHYITTYNMGLIYRSLGDEDTAQRYLLKAIEMEPRFSPAYASLGIMSMEKGQHGTALDYFIKALTHDPSSQQARNYTGLALLRQNQIESAISQFENALEKDPNDLYALTHMGVACKFRGDLNKAEGYFKKVLHINRAYPTASLHLIEVYVLKGQQKEARQTAAQLLEQFPDNMLPLLIDKRIVATDPLLERPDPRIIAPVLEEALLKKGPRYRDAVKKIRSYRKLKPPGKTDHTQPDIQTSGEVN
ncbi:MAG: tetratricopeptide repeat protein [Deltaproteobacteria bacterium]|nr:tetratricopeptide repeat protein [Deltaproteobacteria bacterium]